jgi:hypothetical protein
MERREKEARDYAAHLGYRIRRTAVSLCCFHALATGRKWALIEPGRRSFVQ